MSDFIIKKSKIHGKGVFASRNFKKGEVVIKWDLSNTIKKKDIKKLPKNIRKNVYFYKGKYIIPISSPGKYLNHSCDANTFAKNSRDIARRNIKKNEEITIDMSNEAIVGLNMKCRCGSKDCKKIIKSVV
ncbi:MAG: SET domain-containing protein-lysine N-methyltransferase [bacterium]